MNNKKIDHELLQNIADEIENLKFCYWGIDESISSFCREIENPLYNIRHEIEQIEDKFSRFCREIENPLYNMRHKIGQIEDKLIKLSEVYNAE